MVLEKTELMFRFCGTVNGLSRKDHGYGFKEGKTQSGKDYKRVGFNMSLAEKGKDNVRVGIFGMKRDLVYYWNPEDRAVEHIKWEERKSIPANCRVFPLAWDAAVSMEMADDGDWYFVSGVIGGRTSEDNKTFRSYDIDRAVIANNQTYLNEVSGKFVFDSAYETESGRFIKGYTVNYRGDVLPVQFRWDGRGDFDEIKALKFGTTCVVRKASVYCDVIKRKTSKNEESCDFGTVDDDVIVKTVSGISLSAFSVAKNVSPYSASDLGIDSDLPFDTDDDDEVF